ncbi:hypothetical protein CEXT_515251 [Caerostris extrusa]|uniref:Uncharacterized protein n=1 Tax=Caerostris extrusa TaxID=172846 RepID=A0AAV4NUB5_CAEEX|nr:hypothetical protein CEXT_515251 [Caerostris extrusa]
MITSVPKLPNREPFTDRAGINYHPSVQLFAGLPHGVESGAQLVRWRGAKPGDGQPWCRSESGTRRSHPEDHG